MCCFYSSVGPWRSILDTQHIISGQQSESSAPNQQITFTDHVSVLGGRCQLSRLHRPTQQAGVGRQRSQTDVRRCGVGRRQTRQAGTTAHEDEQDGRCQVVWEVVEMFAGVLATAVQVRTTVYWYVSF